MRKKMTWIVLLVVGLAMAFSSFAMADGKEYVTINNGMEYLRCQPVKGYSGDASGATGSDGEWWLIKMKPAAIWNSPACLAKGSELTFENGKPVKNVICGNNVVVFERIQTKTASLTSVPVITQKTCNEGVFSGRVPANVLRVKSEGSSAIELHMRPGKSQPYKAKRGFVKTDGNFYPETWSDGSCMVKKSSNPLTNVELAELLHAGETLSQVMEEDAKTQFTDHTGRHDTIALYVINK